MSSLFREGRLLIFLCEDKILFRSPGPRYTLVFRVVPAPTLSIPHLKTVYKSKVLLIIVLPSQPSLSISNCQRPCAGSPQLCVVIKAQSVNPLLALSLDLLASNVDLVPIIVIVINMQRQLQNLPLGEIRKISISPLFGALKVTIA